MGVIYFWATDKHWGQRSNFGSRLTEKNQNRRKCGNNGRVATLLHDEVDNRDSQAAQDGGESSHANIRDVILSIAVSNVFEIEVPIESNEPASQTEEQFCEWRVHIEVVLPQDIVRGKFTEMDLVEAAQT